MKVAAIRQEAPAASVEPQGLVDATIAKFPELAPPRRMLEMFSVALPGFESVSVCAEAVDPTVVLGNVRLVGVSTACGAGAAVPVPVKGTVWGEPDALSVKTIEPVCAPVVSGVKVKVKVQLAPTAIEVGHVATSANGPLTRALVSCSGAPPELVMVSDMGAEVVFTCWLPKLSEVGLSVNCGAVPVPVSTASCGDPAALSATETFAVSTPEVVGLKSIVMPHDAPAAKFAGQEFVSLKLLALTPVMLIELIASGAVPVLVSVIGVGAFACEPTGVAGKANGLGARVATGASGAVPVPVSATV